MRLQSACGIQAYDHTIFTIHLVYAVPTDFIFKFVLLQPTAPMLSFSARPDISLWQLPDFVRI